MSVQTYNFSDHISGDTFAGVQFTITVNSVPLNLAGASALMQIKSSKSQDVPYVKQWSTGQGLTITNPVGGVLQFDQQIVDVIPLKYYYDIQITLADGSVKTYIQGTWNILPDVTR